MARVDQHYMTEKERYKLESYLEAKKSVAWIARQMGFCRQTIYNEIRRGTYLHTVDWKDVERYSAEKGQDIQNRGRRNKGRPLKIEQDPALADFLMEKISEKRFSPAAALAEARKQGFTLHICVGTVYNYIYHGVFYRVSYFDLWEKVSRKPRKKTEQRVAHQKLPSIEQRPKEIKRRSELGHWEMDLVVGPQKSRAVLLTLTERRSRFELIFKLPDKQALNVRKVFNRLERSMGREQFRKTFRSITTDNGSEFLEYRKLVRSVYGGKRFAVWYCHSYAAWEKGTNENHNRMIRRFFPKGTDFDRVDEERIQKVQDWMNQYPRKRLGWRTPEEMAA